ncbi:MAG: M48 family metallopeptidase [Deltaproteobacteria bacterium]
MPDNAATSEKAKRYSAIKYVSSIVDTAYMILLLAIFAGSGASKVVAASISDFFARDFLTLPAYLLVVYIGYSIVNFPLNFYRSFVVERVFHLSNQKAADWLKDQLKSGMIFYLISFILFAVFYYTVAKSPRGWWVIVSLAWIFFSIIMAKLFPLIIIPLFFKYKPVSDDVLRQRIIGLAAKMRVSILNVFEIDFSKKTVKANAAFVGWGKGRRVILADTLKNKYTVEEIEVILAHEFAHYRLKHLIKLILINSFVTLVTFYLIFKTSGYVLGLFGFSSLGDIAAFPLILLYFVIFGLIMQPIANYSSRIFERNADLMALRVTGLKEAFISMMEKLASQNLADPKPSRLVKVFFFDHPPIEERIALAKSFNK